MIITEVTVRRYVLPRATPIETASIAAAVRHGWWLTLQTDTGLTGLGEAAPWPGFGGGFVLTHKHLNEMPAQLMNRPIREVFDELSSEETRIEWTSEARFAVETAVMDLISQQLDVSLGELLWNAPSTRLPVNRIVDDARSAQRAMAEGIRHYKVKVGRKNIAHEVALVRDIRREIGTGSQLWLDANGGWPLDEVVGNIDAFAPFDIAWIEQPTLGVSTDEMAQIRAQSPIPIGLDEDLTCLESMQRFSDADAMDVAVIKPMFVGGLIAAQRMIKAAHSQDKKVVVTTSLESNVGRIAAGHLASGIGSSPFGFGDELVNEPRPLSVPVRATLHLPNRPGLGVSARRETVKLPPTLDNNCAAYPSDLALVFSHRSWSWSELTGAVKEAAAGLHSAGVKAGDVVALYGPRSARWIIGWHALEYVGAVAAPLTRSHSKSRLGALLKSCRADYILTTDDQEIEVENGPKIIVLAPGTAPPPSYHWGLDETRIVLFTSGTTGPAKCVPLTMRQLVFSAAGSALRLGHLPGDRWLACLPLEHMGDLAPVIRTALYGTTLHLLEKFDAQLVNRLIDDHCISQISVVPRMLEAMLAERGDRTYPNSLRTILVGGARTPPELIERSRLVRAPVAVSWGMSETASQVATAPAGQSTGDERVGPPLPFTSVYNDAERLFVSGPTAPIQPLATQDSGYVDDAGWVVVSGRIDDIINTGGKLVSPGIIEDVLRSHPQVEDAAVVGLPDPEWGQRIVACLVTTDQIAADTLVNWCREYLARHEVPKEFRRCTALPRTEMGKLKRQSIAKAIMQWPVF